jgi:CheY-like chemotaxis protein
MALTILMIDDNSTVLLANETMLRKAGCVLDEDILYRYASGETFFTDYDGQNIDIAIVDYDLGPRNANGYDVLTQMQMSGFFGIAVLLTGDDSDQMQKRIKLTSGMIYLHKEAGVIDRLCEVIESARSDQVL